MNTSERQTNDMSDDAKRDDRNLDALAQATAPAGVAKRPMLDRGDPSDIEAFDEEGAGIAAKE